MQEKAIAKEKHYMLPLKSIKLTTTNKGNTIKLRNKAKKAINNRIIVLNFFL